MDSKESKDWLKGRLGADNGPLSECELVDTEDY